MFQGRPREPQSPIIETQGPSKESQGSKRGFRVQKKGFRVLKKNFGVVKEVATSAKALGNNESQVNEVFKSVRTVSMSISRVPGSATTVQRRVRNASILTRIVSGPSRNNRALQKNVRGRQRRLSQDRVAWKGSTHLPCNFTMKGSGEANFMELTIYGSSQPDFADSLSVYFLLPCLPSVFLLLS